MIELTNTLKKANALVYYLLKNWGDYQKADQEQKYFSYS